MQQLTYIGGILFWLAGMVGAMAQQADTVQLDPVTIYGLPGGAYAQGSKTQVISLEPHAVGAAQGAHELLMARTPLHFKVYGSGIATISFRGTSASHTALLWNGLPANALTLGQADFALFPLAAFNKVEVQYGPGSARAGSGALGGSINLSNQMPQGTGHTFTQSATTGSFGLRAFELGHQMAKGAWHSSTKVYSRSLANNFNYQDLTRVGQPSTEQRHAANRQYGLTQSLHYQPRAGHTLGLNAWWHQANRQIQPLMGDFSSQDVQNDAAIRLSAHYQIERGTTLWQGQVGYLRDWLEFNGGTPIIGRRFIVKSQYEWAPSPQWQLSSGFQGTLATAQSANFEAQGAAEDRLALYALAKYSPVPTVVLSANIRQSLVQGYRVPFTPSVGAEWTFLQAAGHRLTIKGQAARAYRVPTLNDRFWQPGGNPGLAPENSLNAEAGLVHRFASAGFNIQTELTAYTLEVDDWIIWLPTGAVWSPQNIRQVQGRGAEALVNASGTFSAVQWQLNATAAWNTTVNLTPLAGTGQETQNQLPYTPETRANATYTVQFMGWHAGVEWQHTGSRRVNNTESLPAFNLWGLRAGHEFSGPLNGLSLFAQVQNLFNKQYQNMRLLAMPGTNWVLDLRYRFTL